MCVYGDDTGRGSFCASRRGGISTRNYIPRSEADDQNHKMNSIQNDINTPLSLERQKLLRLCEYSDRDCVHYTVLQTRQPSTRSSNDVHFPWPSATYSCDFCDTWPMYIGECGECHRRVGLSGCSCATKADRVDLVAAAKLFTLSQRVVVDRIVRCGWCAFASASKLPVPPRTTRSSALLLQEVLPPPDRGEREQFTALSPLSCGSSRGLLRRVFFILEPVFCDRWRFEVAHHVLTNLLLNLGVGSFALYSIRFDAVGTSLSDALSLIRQFCERPSAFLPSDSRIDSGSGTLLRVSVLIGAHTAHRDVATTSAVSIEVSTTGTTRTVAWPACSTPRTMTGRWSARFSMASSSHRR
jgi:hypothetical protein